MAKKPDGLAIVFGHGKPPKGEDPEVPMGDEPEGEDEDYGGFETACKEFFEHLGIALPAEKEQAACEALRNLIHLADEEPHEEGPHEENEEPEGE